MRANLMNWLRCWCGATEILEVCHSIRKLFSIWHSSRKCVVAEIEIYKAVER